MNRSCNPAPKGLHHRPMSAARVSITPGLPRTFLRFPGITDSRWAGYSHLRQARRSACLEPMGQARRSKEGRNPNPSKKGNPMRSPCRQEWRTLPAPPRALSSGWRLLACMAAVAGAASAQPADSDAPLRISANHRFLIDRHDVPFLLQGDAAWSLIANATREEADAYLRNRRAKGFNAILVNLIEHKFAKNAPARSAPGRLSEDGFRRFPGSGRSGFVCRLTVAGAERAHRASGRSRWWSLHVHP